MNSDPIVSVLISTYNHGSFIAEAIEGALMQKTEFSFEIIISDDCSTDETRQTVEDFQRHYPDRIRTFFSAKNEGGHANFDRLFNEARGRYVSLLEGDDYWTDSLKLQKQVDFLERNPDFAICFHNLEIKTEGQQPEITGTTNHNEPTVSSLERITRFNYIWTVSCVFRKNLIAGIPSWVHTLPLGDWPLFVLLAEKGSIRYLDEVMGVYRIHPGGVWSKQAQQKKMAKTVRVAEVCRKHLGHPGFDDCIFKTSRTIARQAWKNGNYRRALRFFAKCAGIVLRRPSYGVKVMQEDRKHRRQANGSNA